MLMIYKILLASEIDWYFIITPILPTENMIHDDFRICPHFYVTTELACCRFAPIISAIFMSDSHHDGLNELCGYLH